MYIMVPVVLVLVVLYLAYLLLTDEPDDEEVGGENTCYTCTPEVLDITDEPDDEEVGCYTCTPEVLDPEVTDGCAPGMLYTEWGGCSTNCGPSGVKTAKLCGYEDYAEYDTQAPCNTDVVCQPGCFGNNAFSTWSECSKNCGTGTRSRYDCSTTTLMSEPCNAHSCPEGCEGGDVEEAGWVTIAPKPTIGMYTEHNVNCVLGTTQVRYKYVTGFNGDGLRLGMYTDGGHQGFQVEIDPGVFFGSSEDQVPTDGTYEVNIQALHMSEGGDVWERIHDVDIPADTVRNGDTLRVRFQDIPHINKVGLMYTYRAVITYTHTDGKVNRGESAEYMIPNHSINPVDCEGVWSDCVGGIQAYTFTEHALFDGRECDYANSQVRVCDTSEISSDNLKDDCAYRPKLVNFTALLRTYEMNPYHQINGQSGIVIYDDLSLIEFGPESYLRNLSRSNNRWAVTSDITEPQTTAGFDKITLQRVGNVNDLLILKVGDRYLKKTNHSYLFNDIRTFELLFDTTDRSEAQSNGDYWFVKESSVANGALVTRLRTYQDSLPVGFGYLNPHFFVAYDTNDTYALLFQFEIDIGDNSCSENNTLDDGLSACVMSPWTYVGDCDTSTCEQEMERSHQYGRNTGCDEGGILSKTVSCNNCDCTMNEWSEYGECDFATCVQTSTRSGSNPDCPTSKSISCSISRDDNWDNGPDGEKGGWDNPCSSSADINCDTGKVSRSRPVCENGVKTTEVDEYDCTQTQIDDACCTRNGDGWGPWGVYPQPHKRGVFQEYNADTGRGCTEVCGDDGWQYSYKEGYTALGSAARCDLLVGGITGEYASRKRACNRVPCTNTVRFYSFVQKLDDPNHRVGAVALSTLTSQKVYIDIDDMTGEIGVGLEDTGVSLQRQPDGTVKIFKDGFSQQWYLVYTARYMKWVGSTAMFAGPEVENPTDEGYWIIRPYILEGKLVGDLRDSEGNLKHGTTWTGGGTYLGTTELGPNRGFMPWYIDYGDYSGSLRWTVGGDSTTGRWELEMAQRMGLGVNTAQVGYSHVFVADGVSAEGAYPTADVTDSYAIRYSNGDIAQEQG